MKLLGQPPQGSPTQNLGHTAILQQAHAHQFGGGMDGVRMAAAADIGVGPLASAERQTVFIHCLNVTLCHQWM